MSKKPKPGRAGNGGRTIGFLQGKLMIPDDFDAPLPQEVQDAFEGVAARRPPSTPPEGDESLPSSASKRTWNYRVLSFTHGEDAWCAIHEVYYDDDVPTAYSSSPAVVLWDPNGEDGAGIRIVERMMEALGKPVLTEGDFGQE